MRGAPLAAKLSDLDQSGRSRTLAERAFGMLHVAIVTGLLEPGERLPIEEVGTGLGMSPMPVREALRRLHDAGLVELVPHRGARVTELSLKNLREIYDTRLALEPLAIARAAERFTADDEREARGALDRHIEAYEHGTPVNAFSAHTDFHFALYKAARSTWLERLITPLWESSQGYRLALSPRHRGDLRERRAEHERMLAACVARQPERAAAELYDHLSRTANRVAERMGTSPLFALIEDSKSDRKDNPAPHPYLIFDTIGRTRGEVADERAGP